MNAVARYLARLIWGNLLWTMRRPWMKRLQRASGNLFPAARQDRFRQSVVKQNRWARRYGFALLTFSLNLFLASVIVTGTYFLVLGLYESGQLSMPDSMRHNVSP